MKTKLMVLALSAVIVSGFFYRPPMPKTTSFARGIAPFVDPEIKNQDKVRIDTLKKINDNYEKFFNGIPNEEPEMSFYFKNLKEIQAYEKE